MKNRIVYLIKHLILYLTIPTFLPAQNLDGWWKNDQTNLLLLVESTDDGFQTKRLDQEVWYTYIQFREGQFRDHDGNTYFLMGDRNLEWEDHRGSKRLRFHRSDTPLEYVNRRNGYSSYPDTDYKSGKNENNNVNSRSLDGRWINLSTSQKIFVKSKRNRIKVKANRGGWATFDRTNRRGWIDQQGNRYEFRNGRLIYTSRNGDFMMRFVKRS